MRVSPFRDTLKLLKNIPKQTGAIVEQSSNRTLELSCPVSSVKKRPPQQSSYLKHNVINSFFHCHIDGFNGMYDSCIE